MGEGEVTLRVLSVVLGIHWLQKAQILVSLEAPNVDQAVADLLTGTILNELDLDVVVGLGILEGAEVVEAAGLSHVGLIS